MPREILKMILALKNQREQVYKSLVAQRYLISSTSVPFLGSNQTFCLCLCAP